MVISNVLFYFQIKVVDKFFSGHQLTTDNLRMVNQSLQHRLEYVRVRPSLCVCVCVILMHVFTAGMALIVCVILMHVFTVRVWPSLCVLFSMHVFTAGMALIMCVILMHVFTVRVWPSLCVLFSCMSSCRVRSSCAGRFPQQQIST